MRAEPLRFNPLGALVVLALTALLGAAAFASVAKAEYEENGVTYGAKIIEYKTELTSSAPGVAATQAGGHPDVKLQFRLGTKLDPENPPGTSHANSVKELLVELPEGFIGDTHATPQCSKAEFAQSTCSPDSQIGWVNAGIEFTEGCRHHPQNCDGFVPCCGMPLYNLIPPPNQAGLLGFQAILFGYPTYTVLSARTGSDFGLNAHVVGISQVFPLRLVEQFMWGVPASPVHDEKRYVKGGLIPIQGPTKSNAPEKPFLTNPTTCSGPLTTILNNVAYDGVPTSKSASWPATTGCDLLGFAPSLSAVPSTAEGDSASGVDITLQVPQTPSPVAPSDSQIKDLTVRFPEGFTINPNAADGKVACADSEANFGSEAEAECPQFAKIGTLTLVSSALPEPIPGGIYIGAPLPGDRYRVFLTADGFGTHIKLAGSTRLDPQTGRLTIVFENLPQSPLTEFRMHFFGSERGLFATPPGCGKYAVEADFSPWDALLPVQHSIQFFQVTSGPEGSPCATDPRPFSPGFRAVGQVNGAGLHGSLSIQVTRPDGDQNLAGLTTKMLPGLAATLKGIPYCSETAIAQASSSAYSGLAELASPSCPEASQVGTATTGTGAGTHPYYTQGKVYLAGPYKGAPLSLVVISPAVSGPYDLGDVVVRAALQVDPETAQVTAVSDPLPSILEGIPLRMRSILINLDRANFTLNPTSCEPHSIQSTITGAEGSVATPADHFQVGNCGVLGYEPKLSLRLNGGLGRLGHPAIHATLKARAGEANTARVSVALPPGEILDNSHIGDICTRVQFNAEQCPASSAIGTAKATTPLLDKPLEGKVYLRSSPEGGLPNLAVDLRGQLDIVLVGKIDTVHGGSLRTTFQTVPDAPVEEFKLDLAGGKKGLLQNSEPVCGRRLRATVKMVGQNAAHYDSRPPLQGNCGNGKAKKGRKHRRGGPR